MSCHVTVQGPALSTDLGDTHGLARRVVGTLPPNPVKLDCHLRDSFTARGDITDGDGPGVPEAEAWRVTWSGNTRGSRKAVPPGGSPGRQQRKQLLASEAAPVALTRLQYFGHSRSCDLCGRLAWRLSGSVGALLRRSDGRAPVYPDAATAPVVNWFS